MSRNPGIFTVVTFFVCSLLFSTAALSQGNDKRPAELKLWYNQPASDWNEALPVGNGSLGAMVFGKMDEERIQLNEETVWVGKPSDFVNPEARKALPQVRKLLFAGKYAEAQQMAQEKMMGDKKVWSTYQTLGDLTIDFDSATGKVDGYRRELDLENAIAGVSYSRNKVTYTREIFSSAPDKAWSSV